MRSAQAAAARNHARKPAEQHPDAEQRRRPNICRMMPKRSLSATQILRREALLDDDRGFYSLHLVKPLNVGTKSVSSLPNRQVEKMMHHHSAAPHNNQTPCSPPCSPQSLPAKRRKDQSRQRAAAPTDASTVKDCVLSFQSWNYRDGLLP